MAWITTRILFILCCFATPGLDTSLATNIGGLIVVAIFMSAIKTNRTIAILPILGGFFGLLQFLILIPARVLTAYPIYAASFLLVNLAQLIIMFIILFNKQIKYYESAIKQSLSAGN